MEVQALSTTGKQRHDVIRPRRAKCEDPLMGVSLLMVRLVLSLITVADVNVVVVVTAAACSILALVQWKKGERRPIRTAL